MSSERDPGAEAGGARGDETRNRLEQLLERLEEARRRLDEIDDPEQAVDVFQNLVDIAKALQAEIDRERREDAGAPD